MIYVKLYDAIKPITFVRNQGKVIGYNIKDNILNNCFKCGVSFNKKLWPGYVYKCTECNVYTIPVIKNLVITKFSSQMKMPL